jgi:hypothetical protein
MTNYVGPDKLVGALIGTIGPTVLYWENVKTVDVQRLVNSVVLNVENETHEYGGFGRESFKDVEVTATFFLLENSPLTLVDEARLENYLSAIHTDVNNYLNSSQTDFVVGNPVVWVKILNEKREDEVRGIIFYEITFQVRIYIPQTTIAVGSSTTGLMQLMLNFLGNLPVGSTGPWAVISFSTTKTVDLQRTGNIAVVHAPTIVATGAGMGVTGNAPNIQLSHYTFKLTLHGNTEADVVAATDWIAANSVMYFLNASFGAGNTILSKMLRYGQVLNERGTWHREIDIMVEAILGT